MTTDLQHRLLEAFDRSFPALDPGKLAILAQPVTAGPDSDTPLLAHNPDQLFYPASVCKLFYMACYFALAESGELKPMSEDQRALENMMQISSNDATSYLLDRICGTTGGPDLPLEELEQWLQQRSRVEQWLRTWCPADIALGQVLRHSTFSEGPYGRERQAREIAGGNQVSARASVAMMQRIFEGNGFSGEHQAAMRALLHKDKSYPERYQSGSVHQLNDFISGSLPQGAECWSKAGWTSNTRHEVAFVQLADQRRFMLAILTSGEDMAQAPVIPWVTRTLLSMMD